MIDPKPAGIHPIDCLLACFINDKTAANNERQYVQTQEINKEEKVSVVSQPNTCSKPRAMMVKSKDAVITDAAMTASRRAVMQATLAPLVSQAWIILNQYRVVVVFKVSV